MPEGLGLADNDVRDNFPVSNSKCGNQIHCCNPNNKVVYYIRNIVHNNKSQCLLAPISCVNVTTWNVQFVQFERLILIWGQLKWRIQREFDFRTWLSLCLMRIKLLYSIARALLKKIPFLFLTKPHLCLTTKRKKR